MEEQETEMKVMVGWSGETERGVWRKHDVELEENDFTAYSQEYGFKDLPAAVKYAFLENEATLLVATWVARHSETHRESAEQQVRQCQERRGSLLDVILND